MDIAGDGQARPATRAASAAAEVRCRGVPAEPARFPPLRRMLAAWAEYLGMETERIEALVLASYEALANAAEHAYVGESGGHLELHAVYMAESAQAHVTVIDRGQWQPPSETGTRLGGRGLVLIENLAEQSDVTTGPTGTVVRMAWTVPSTVDALESANA